MATRLKIHDIEHHEDPQRFPSLHSASRLPTQIGQLLETIAGVIHQTLWDESPPFEKHRRAPADDRRFSTNSHITGVQITAQTPANKPHSLTISGSSDFHSLSLHNGSYRVYTFIRMSDNPHVGNNRRYALLGEITLHLCQPRLTRSSCSKAKDQEIKSFVPHCVCLAYRSTIRCGVIRGRALVSERILRHDMTTIDVVEDIRVGARIVESEQ